MTPAQLLTVARSERDLAEHYGAQATELPPCADRVAAFGRYLYHLDESNRLYQAAGAAALLDAVKAAWTPGPPPPPTLRPKDFLP